MPIGPGGLDAQGVWQYGESDTETLASDLLALGQGSISTQFGIDRARMTVIEANVTTLQGKTADTGWITLSLTGGATAASGDVPAYRVLNGVCYFRGAFGTTGTGGSVKATTPVGARPSLAVSLLVRAGTSSTRLSINTSGEISTLNSVADVYLTGVNPYPVT